MSGIASITRSSLKPTTAVTNTSAPYAARSEVTARRMMLSPAVSGVNGLGCGLPRRVPRPAARMTTWMATRPFLSTTRRPRQRTIAASYKPRPGWPSWHSGPVLLETDRLRIRDWTLDEAPAALDMLSRVEVVKWLGDGPPVLCPDLDGARERIERWRGRDHPPLGHWACEVTDGSPLHGRVIGTVLLLTLPNADDGEVEIGWHLHPDAWGHGYASEAARAVLRHGFEAGLTDINAVTHLGNAASQAVCRRIEMEHRGVVERWYDGPSEHFVVSRGQWAARSSSGRDGLLTG